jgi:hypothetical protein
LAHIGCAQPRDRRVERVLVDGVVVVGRHHALPAVVALARHDHGAVVDRAGQDQAVVVVGMLADQVDPARGLDLDREGAAPKRPGKRGARAIGNWFIAGSG